MTALYPLRMDNWKRVATVAVLVSGAIVALLHKDTSIAATLAGAAALCAGSGGGGGGGGRALTSAWIVAWIGVGAAMLGACLAFLPHPDRSFALVLAVLMCGGAGALRGRPA